MKKILPLLVVLTACTPEQTNSIDIQGHRGARGLMPENSIPGFIKALDLGVTTLELDLAVTGDGELLVSHEPYFSADFCADPLGNRVDTIYNIYEMSWMEIKQFDCGSLDHHRFPDQEKLAVYKPRLIEVIDTVEQYINEKGLEKVAYNIEIKSRIDADERFHPNPKDFSDLVYQTLNKYDFWDRVTIQSFDFRNLQYINERYQDISLALLIENKLNWKQNIDSLGFTPDIYSCDYQLLSQSQVLEIKKAGMRVIPWTVNDTKQMAELIQWGVDGIITDYPDRAIDLIQSNNE